MKKTTPLLLLTFLIIEALLPSLCTAGIGAAFRGIVREVGNEVKRDVKDTLGGGVQGANPAGQDGSSSAQGPIQELIERTHECPPPKFPLDDEIAYGETIAAKMINYYGSRLLDPKEHKVVWEYCNLLLQSMVPNSLRPDLPTWRVGIVVSDEIGAVAAPGGFIIITTATLRSCKNEAELAGVIAHEMAHICRRHGLHTIWSGLKKTVWLRHWAKNAKIPVVRKILNGFSEQVRKATEFDLGPVKEFEADKLGAEFMYRTGYNPLALADFIGRLPEAKRPTRPRRRRRFGLRGSFGRNRRRSTRRVSGNRAYGKHPPKAQRVERLRSYCKRKLTGYDQLKKLRSRYEKAILSRFR